MLEKILDMVETAAKHEDPKIYQLNLLARTMRTNEQIVAMLASIHDILDLRADMPPEVAKVIDEEADGLLSGLTATASKKGWFIETMLSRQATNAINAIEDKRLRNEDVSAY